MISKEQMQRALQEFQTLAAEWEQTARAAELEREHFAYLVAPEYDRAAHMKSCRRFEEADYMAESRAWIRNLIQNAIKEFITP